MPPARHSNCALRRSSRSRWRPSLAARGFRDFRMPRFGMLACLGLWIASVCTTLAMAADPVDFARDVKPILAAHCYQCHGEKTQESGFRLDNTRDLLAGGASG